MDAMVKSVIPELPQLSILEPRLYRSIEALCKDALAYTGNHSNIRGAVNRIALEMKRQSNSAYGRDSLDTISLMRLLQNTDPRLAESRPPPKIDPLLDPSLARRITTHQAQAVEVIRDIEDSWSRILKIQGRNYERDGASNRRARPLDPLDAMNEDTYQNWVKYYAPWSKRAQTLFIPVDRGGNFCVLTLVLDIVCHHYHPTDIDERFGFRKGLARDTLLDQLHKFYNPAPKRIRLRAESME